MMIDAFSIHEGKGRKKKGECTYICIYINHMHVAADPISGRSVADISVV